MMTSQTVECPYCGEPNEIEIDVSAGKSQSYVEDCQVCCRPWNVKVRLDGRGHAQVSLMSQEDVDSDE